eukprot:2739114-Alexandrium_andersonii.AAC.1
MRARALRAYGQLALRALACAASLALPVRACARLAQVPSGLPCASLLSGPCARRRARLARVRP